MSESVYLRVCSLNQTANSSLLPWKQPGAWAEEAVCFDGAAASLCLARRERSLLTACFFSQQLSALGEAKQAVASDQHRDTDTVVVLHRGHLALTWLLPTERGAGKQMAGFMGNVVLILSIALWGKRSSCGLDFNTSLSYGDYSKISQSFEHARLPLIIISIGLS